MYARNTLETKARKLAQRFYDNAQALFDDDAMDIDIAEGAVFEALCLAQGAAEDVTNTD